MTPIALRIPLILAAFGLSAATSAQEAIADPLASPDLAAPEPEPELKALADSCSARKFETIVAIPGRERGSRVRICGQPGQSDSDWLNTLRSSVKQTEANAALEPAVKEQIIAALSAEISKVEGTVAASAAAASAVSAATDVPASAITLSEGTIAPAERAPEYSTLPPLPAPKRMAARGMAAAAGSAPADVAPLIPPKLTLRCASPRESFAECARLERESRLLIRAGEDLQGTSLRFLRGRDTRAELDLGSLKKGDTLHEKLPGRVCSGVMRGKVEVQVLKKNRVADTYGPYHLHCGS